MVNIIDKKIEKMFEVGAHFGYSKTRRHPSTKYYIFGVKNKAEIFDLEKTDVLLSDAKEFVKKIASEGKNILFISSKSEAKDAIVNSALAINNPYSVGRWIGGVLTNFSEIKKRIDRFQKLESDKEKGLLSKYTKKERLMIDREIEKLNKNFSGLVSLAGMPAAVFIVDPKKEKIALTEALDKNIPIIALANSDCDVSKIDYPIMANDSAKASIQFFVDEIIEAYNEGKKESKVNKKD